MKGDVAESTLFAKGKFQPTNTNASKPKLRECDEFLLEQTLRIQAAGIKILQPGELLSFKETPGLLLLFLGDDPVRSRETMDLLLIAPEIRALFEHEPITCGVVFPREDREIETLRSVAICWGVKRLPAVALWMEGHFLGALEGFRDWRAYQEGLVGLLLKCQQEFEKQNENVKEERGRSYHPTIPLVPATRTTQDV